MNRPLKADRARPRMYPWAVWIVALIRASRLTSSIAGELVLFFNVLNRAERLVLLPSLVETMSEPIYVARLALGGWWLTRRYLGFVASSKIMVSR